MLLLSCGSQNIEREIDMLYSVKGIITETNGKKRTVFYDIWANCIDDAKLYFQQITVKDERVKISEVTDVYIDHNTHYPPFYIIREQDGKFDILHKRVNKKAKVCEFWVVSGQYNSLDKAEFDLFAFMNDAQPPIIHEASQYIAYSI